MKLMRIFSVILMVALLTPAVAKASGAQDRYQAPLSMTSSCLSSSGQLLAESFTLDEPKSQQAAPAMAASEANSAYRIALPIIANSNQKIFPQGERVFDFQVNTPDVNRYEKFEAEFGVTTNAKFLSLPYDPNPPSGLDSGIGITVDALFSSDNWKTVVVQPAFYYQPYQYSQHDGKDHFTPSGAPRWMVRFAPQKSGTWQYRICVQDADGISYYPGSSSDALSFSVGDKAANTYTQRGFLQVSPTDPRYFEFENGEPFIGVGFNDGFSDAKSVENKLSLYEQTKMNFMRVWLSGSGINGSQWTSWASHTLPGDGYLPGTNFDIDHTYKGADVSFKLDTENPCLYADFWQKGVPAEPNTTYHVWARVKTVDVSGSDGAGFVLKRGGWLGTDCSKTDTGTVMTQPVKGTTDWTEVSGTTTTGSDTYWLDNFYIALQGATSGQAYVDEVRVWRDGDPAKVNLLREPNANSHMYFDPMNSAQWDLFIESAEKHGVYLKLVIDEKNEWIRNRILPDGTMTTKFDNANFYASPDTKVRWLQEAWWRYLIARWGYSTAIHSFEYVNEGDPYDGRHHEAANAMALYFDQHDPSHHMVSTSFWSNFPNLEFWSNDKYPNIDYADLHAYISTGWGLYSALIDDQRIERDLANVHSGTGAATFAGTDNATDAFTPRGVVIRGKGEWTIRFWLKGQDLTADCQNGTTGSKVRVRWQVAGNEGVVPDSSVSGCASPGGTFDWKQITSKDNPSDRRLILPDDKPYEISLSIENSDGTGGRAWIDDVEMISPSGKVVNVNGGFEAAPMDEDTAWYNRAYGDLWGAGNGAGAGKPLVRGETGIDFPDNQDWNRDLTKDTQGIWLHNNVWGQINSGGMYDLFWWADETIPSSIYSNYLTYRNFMSGIPLSNGNYHDVKASVSDPNLRAWGQRDDNAGRMHLWIQNMQHTWKRVVAGDSIDKISGTVTIPDVASGSYQVEWWDPYKVDNPVIRTETLTSSGSLVLQIDSLQTDLAVKITKK